MSRTPPDRAIYFLDENVDGPLLADTLRADGFEIRQLRDCFARGAEDEAESMIVITMGATALRALNRIERHGLVLRKAAGHLHPWYGRKLLPLYHSGLLGRISRNETLQRADMRALRIHLGR